MTVQTETFFGAPAISARFAALREKMTEAVTKRKTYLVTLRELESLTPRDLADLDIAPGSIRSIAHEAAYGK